MSTEVAPASTAEPTPLPPVDRTPLRRRRTRRALTQLACVLVSLFMVGPIVLITFAALSTPDEPAVWSGRWLTFGELCGRAVVVAERLRAMGIRRGAASTPWSCRC